MVLSHVVAMLPISMKQLQYRRVHNQNKKDTQWEKRNDGYEEDYLRWKEKRLKDKKCDEVTFVVRMRDLMGVEMRVEKNL